MFKALLQRKLIPNWRDWWRMGSLRLHALGTLVVGFLLMVPTMPLEVQELIPAQYRAIAIAIWFIGAGYIRLTQKDPNSNG